jgi:hypothetical protein
MHPGSLFLGLSLFEFSCSSNSRLDPDRYALLPALPSRQAERGPKHTHLPLFSMAHANADALWCHNTCMSTRQDHQLREWDKNLLDATFLFPCHRGYRSHGWHLLWWFIVVVSLKSLAKPRVGVARSSMRCFHHKILPSVLICSHISNYVVAKNL